MLRLTTHPIDTVEHTECRFRGRPSAGRVECRICLKTFVLSAVVVDEEKIVPGASGCEVVPVKLGRCRLYCDHCHKVFEWRAEIYEGQPTKNLFGSVKIISDRNEVRKFLRDHPEAAGVQQR